MYKSSNPMLNNNIYKKAQAQALATSSTETMTIQGTVNKTGILLLLVFSTAMYAWKTSIDAVNAMEPIPMNLMWIGVIGGLIFAMITIFKKNSANITAPIYAMLEGLFIGTVSVVFELKYPGIVTQAILGTFGVFFAILFIYKTKIIQATDKFKKGLVAATGGIFFIYLLTMILGFFNVSIPFIHEGGTIGILFSVAVIVIAALNFVMDFDFIEQGEHQKAPKFMEWYGAFGLIVTLVWLYIEILRLLSKLRSRD